MFRQASNVVARIGENSFILRFLPDGLFQVKLSVIKRLAELAAFAGQSRAEGDENAPLPSLQVANSRRRDPLRILSGRVPSRSGAS